ncbi:MAG: OmpP1/FadL family transporter, partial [Persicimonas sp.]
MRICRFILGGSCVLALLLVAPASAFAAGFQNSGQSATATGMAYGGVANPDEPNASFYNPALMGFQDGYRIYVGDTLIMPKTTFQPEGGGDEVATERDFFPPPHVHLGAHNIADSGFSAGVGLSFPYGLGIEWPEDWVGRANIQRQSLRTANINPNIAYRLPDLDLSFAVGAQIMASAIEYERSIPINEDEDEFVDAELGGDGVGFGGNAAVMYRPTDELTLGAQYRSRAKVDYEGSVHFEGEEDTAFYQTFRDNPATASITMPDLIAVGGGYQVLDNLFLHLEVDYTLWETYDEINADIDTGDDEDAIDEITIVNDWENAFAFRLGGQYDVT